MNIKKQEHLLGILLSSNDVFSRCVSILKPEYFDGDLRRAVKFTLEYFEKYNTAPDKATVESETSTTITAQVVTQDKISYACDEIEKYCRESAVAVAMMQSTDDLAVGNTGIILERMQEAVSVSLKKELGWEFFGDNFAEKLAAALARMVTIPTCIDGLDKHLAGGFARQQTTIFTANSGAGKSIMLNNLAHNFAMSGYHTVLLSLELPKEMIFTRTTSITSGLQIQTLNDHEADAAAAIERIRHKTPGTLMIERIKADACTNDIRSYLTHYELELGRKPDALFVDYLDKMTPNQGMSNMNISEQDKYKTEQLAELVYDYNLFCATASQQNRDAIGNMSPKQDVIAGGLTKINTVDNVISLFMSEEMRLRGEMIATFLKTRSSDGVGKQVELFFDTSNLRICDPQGRTSGPRIFDITSKQHDYMEDLKRQLPGIEFNTPEQEIITQDVKTAEPIKNTNLLNFIEDLNNE